MKVRRIDLEFCRLDHFGFRGRWLAYQIGFHASSRGRTPTHFTCCISMLSQDERAPQRSEEWQYWDWWHSRGQRNQGHILYARKEGWIYDKDATLVANKDAR